MTFGVILSDLPVKRHTACLDVPGLGQRCCGADGAVCFPRAFLAE